MSGKTSSRRTRIGARRRAHHVWRQRRFKTTAQTCRRRLFQIRGGDRLAHRAERAEFVGAGGAGRHMRLDVARVPGIELAVDQRVQQRLGFGAVHVRRSFLDVPCRAQHGSRAAQPRHHRSDRHAGDFGDLAIGQVIDLPQHDGFAERLWQRGDKPPDRFAVPPAQQLRFRRRLRLLPYRRLLCRRFVFVQFGGVSVGRAGRIRPCRRFSRSSAAMVSSPDRDSCRNDATPADSIPARHPRRRRCCA